MILNVTYCHIEILHLSCVTIHNILIINYIKPYCFYVVSKITISFILFLHVTYIISKFYETLSLLKIK